MMNHQLRLLINVIRLALLINFLQACESSNAEPGVVSAATPEAIAAGQQILAQGGNAVDAAVAVSFALGVTEPAMSGLGGGSQMLIGIPGETPVLLNGTTYSPVATPIGVSKDSLMGRRRSTVPSAVKTWHTAWSSYGSGRVSWSDCLQPAIQYAINGFEVGSFRAKVYQRYKRQLLRDTSQTGYWLINGQLPQEGEVLKQPVLAKTMEILAKNGGDEFYTGSMAKQIGVDMAENKGWISVEDLNSFPNPPTLSALHLTYRGYDIYTAPPPCGGWTMLLAFKVLETLEKENTPLSSLERRMEAIRLAHIDRKKAPVIDFENYEKTIQEKLSSTYAKSLWGYPNGFPQEQHERGETTHFTVVDANGLVVAVTSSINAYFGAKTSSSQLGFLYNSYMDDFTFGDTLHPRAIRPEKMAYSSMTPTIVMKDGEIVLGLGSPGSARIISAVFQVILNWIEMQDIQKAIDHPRIHSIFPNFYLESSTDSARLVHFIDSIGGQIKTVRTDLQQNDRNAYFGGVHAVALENGRWVAGVDPRRDGVQ